MNYQLFIHPSAEKAVTAIPRDDQQSVRAAIRALTATPRPRGCIKLTDRGVWRIRVGSYRVIYEIDDAQRTVTVVKAGHRRDAYS